ncbi:MAG: hypothetical protein ACRCUE_00155 [Bosea sp. (in: a-proteobacteria)]
MTDDLFVWAAAEAARPQRQKLRGKSTRFSMKIDAVTFRWRISSCDANREPWQYKQEIWGPHSPWMRPGRLVEMGGPNLVEMLPRRLEAEAKRQARRRFLDWFTGEADRYA